MNCPKCNYTWKPKKSAPKCCPQCKTRLNLPPRTIVFMKADLNQVLKEGTFDCIDNKTGETIRVVRLLIK